MADGCPKYPCGQITCQTTPVCAKPTCPAVKTGCKRVEDAAQNNDGCLKNPCGTMKCETAATKPKSLCKINPELKNVEMKAGDNASVAVATTVKEVAAGKLNFVTDIAKQCPGDRFYVDCTPAHSSMKFDPQSGKASAVAPSSKTALVTSCKITKKNADGTHEEKSYKIMVAADPKATTDLNKDKKPTTDTKPTAGKCVPKAGKAAFVAFCNKDIAKTPAGCAAKASAPYCEWKAPTAPVAGKCVLITGKAASSKAFCDKDVAQTEAGCKAAAAAPYCTW